MTCLEKYKMEHPIEYDECNEVVYDHCPSDYGYLADPVNCQCVSSDKDIMTCEECWNREIPEEKEEFNLEKLEKKLNSELDIPEELIDKFNSIGCTSFSECFTTTLPYRPDLYEIGSRPSILDSGNRREFETGAVRDIQEGKGRCDLMPLDVVAHFHGKLMDSIAAFKNDGHVGHLYTAIERFIQQNYKGNYYTAFLEVAKHFEEGAKKYGENNWQKGIPVHCYIDSAVRHYLKYLRGDKDEPHDRAFVWNIMCCIWTCIHKPELNEYRKENE